MGCLQGAHRPGPPVRRGRQRVPSAPRPAGRCAGRASPGCGGVGAARARGGRARGSETGHCGLGPTLADVRLRGRGGPPSPEPPGGGQRVPRRGGRPGAPAADGSPPESGRPALGGGTEAGVLRREGKSPVSGVIVAGGAVRQRTAPGGRAQTTPRGLWARDPRLRAAFQTVWSRARGTSREDLRDGWRQMVFDSFLLTHSLPDGRTRSRCSRTARLVRRERGAAPRCLAAQRPLGALAHLRGARRLAPRRPSG